MGYIVSFSFVFVIIGIATILEKQKLVSVAGSRKIIHIGVSNWWFLAMFFFTDPLKVSIIPACFIVINYLSYKKNIFSAMERGEGPKDLGTVYYSISLLILSLWTFYINKPEIGLLGIMLMGYGDGFAALVGKKWGKTPLYINNKKTQQGSITVFFFSLIITLAILSYYYVNINFLNRVVISIFVGFLATLIEAITPNGFDNISLPITSSMVFYGIVQYLG